MVEAPIWSVLVANRLVRFPLLLQRQGYKGTEMFMWEFSKGSVILNPHQYWALTFNNIQQTFSPATSQKPNHNFLEKNMFSFLPTFHEITFALKPRTDHILSHVSNRFKVQLLHKWNCWKTSLKETQSYPPTSTFMRKGKYLYTEELLNFCIIKGQLYFYWFLEQVKRSYPRHIPDISNIGITGWFQWKTAVVGKSCK